VLELAWGLVYYSSFTINIVAKNITRVLRKTKQLNYTTKLMVLRIEKFTICRLLSEIFRSKMIDVFETIW